MIDESGEWGSDKECLKNLAVAYYYALFSAKNPHVTMYFMKGNFLLISHDQKLDLEKEISREEVLACSEENRTIESSQTRWVSDHIPPEDLECNGSYIG